MANERISILKRTTLLTVLLYTTPNIFYPHLNRHDIIMRAKSPQSCPTLDPMDRSLPGSSVHGILHTRILQWVAISFSRGSSQPRHRIHISHVSCTGRQVLYHKCHLGNPMSLYSLAIQIVEKVEILENVLQRRKLF